LAHTAFHKQSAVSHYIIHSIGHIRTDKQTSCSHCLYVTCCRYSGRPFCGKPRPSTFTSEQLSRSGCSSSSSKWHFSLQDSLPRAFCGVSFNPFCTEAGTDHKHWRRHNRFRG